MQRKDGEGGLKFKTEAARVKKTGIIFLCKIYLAVKEKSILSLRTLITLTAYSLRIQITFTVELKCTLCSRSFQKVIHVQMITLSPVSRANIVDDSRGFHTRTRSSQTPIRITNATLNAMDL